MQVSTNAIGGGAMMGAGIGLSGGPIGAVGGAGIGLYMDEMRRGGWAGVGEATRAAPCSAEVGGPIGAAIGAGVGFLSGVVRLFVKGATEKARKKIKATYGVDIADKAILTQIVNTANQAFGGNLDMAIRSQQVRDLVELYAMSTGQSTKGLPGTAHPLDLVQAGGSLYQSPRYSRHSPSGHGRFAEPRPDRGRRGIERGSDSDPVGRAGHDGTPAR